jgi:hypothetical protein
MTTLETPKPVTPTGKTVHKEAVDKVVSKEVVDNTLSSTSVKVKNITFNDLFLESGCIKPGETGLATAAERSNLLGSYLEEA